MARALPTHCPTMRIRRGKSFGPTTTSATTSRMRIWLQLRSSNIAKGRRYECVAVSFFGLVARKFARRGLLVGEALLEAVDALGEVAHQVGNLAAAAEQDQRDRSHQQDMPDAQATHETLLL